MKRAGYTCVEAKQTGYTCAEAKRAGYIEGLKAAGYTCAEAKRAGYTCAEAKQAGYTCAEAKAGGFMPIECVQAGFTYEEGSAAGFLGNDSQWNPDTCKPPPRIELRLTLAARALHPPPPSKAGRGSHRAAARAARVLRAARRRGEPTLPSHAHSCAWRLRYFF